MWGGGAAWPGDRGRNKSRNEGDNRSVRLAGTLAVAALPQPALSETPASALQRHALEAMGLFPALDLHEATYISVVMGVLAVSILTALVHLRERRRWNARERRLLAEVTDLREVKDRSELLLGSERQLLVAFLGRDGEARFEGDPSIAGESASVKRVLAFGSWLAPADAGLIEAALEHLRQRGEGFRLTVRTLTRSFVEAEGRTIGGRAILRLRDVTGDHSALLQARSQLASAKADLRRDDDIARFDCASLVDPRCGRSPRLGKRSLLARRRGRKRRGRGRPLARTSRSQHARRGKPAICQGRPVRRARLCGDGGPAAYPRRRRAADRRRLRGHRRRCLGTRIRARRSAAADGRPCAHPRPVADRRRDLRRLAASRLQQPGLPATLEPRPGLPRAPALRQRSARSPARIAQIARAGGLSARGRPISFPATRRRSRRRPGGISRTGARFASSSTRTRKAA